MIPSVIEKEAKLCRHSLYSRLFSRLGAWAGLKIFGLTVEISKINSG